MYQTSYTAMEELKTVVKKSTSDFGYILSRYLVGEN